MFLIVAHRLQRCEFLVRCNAMEPEVKFPSNWTPPYELMRALPRELERTGAGTFMIVMAFLFFLGTVPLFLMLWNANTREKEQFTALRDEGRETIGTITRLFKSGKSSTRRMDYQFSAGGGEASGTSTVPRDIWDTLSTGDSITIRYLPRDPNVNHPARWEDPPGPLWVVMFVPLVIGSSGFMFLWLLRYEAKYLESGTPTPGVVTKTYRSKSGYIIRYQYRRADGALGKGSTSRGTRPEIGEVITVLYDPHHPQRSRMYPGSLYRVRTV